jgi:putative intracellular protease/amidase
MLRGLEGRRIALYARGDDRSIRSRLEDAGAQVVDLSAGAPAEEDWHSGKYAALVIGSCVEGDAVQPRALQLLREFLVADKPVAVVGEGVRALEEAGALQTDAVLADAAGSGDFAERLVRAFSDRLDEAQVDDMSEQSFPASDPPSVTPTSAGPGSESRA